MADFRTATPIVTAVKLEQGYGQTILDAIRHGVSMPDFSAPLVTDRRPAAAPGQGYVYDSRDTDLMIRHPPDQTLITGIKSHARLDPDLSLTINDLLDLNAIQYKPPLHVTQPFPGLYWGEKTLELYLSAPVSFQNISGMLTCSFMNVQLPLWTFYLTIDSISVYIDRYSGMVAIRQGDNIQNISVEDDSDMYTLAWCADATGIDVYVWRGSPGQAVRDMRHVHQEIQPDVLRDSVDVKVGGNYSYLHQFVWNDPACSPIELLDRAVAMDGEWMALLS